jgi:hypothetical protein
MPACEYTCTDPQLEFMAATDPYVDFEGSVRSGKTTFLCRKIRDYGLKYPGICMGLTRWTQDGLDAVLKPKWREILGEMQVPFEWNGKEEYDKLPNGSLCYLRGLRAAEESMRFGKLAGLTLSILGVDQAEEIGDEDKDVYQAYVPARLSQVGYPHQVILTPNPPAEDHWVAQEFPEDNSKPGYRYIRAELWDMAPILGQDYVNELASKYPPGSALYRRFVEGRRGLGLVGDAVYGGYFLPTKAVGGHRIPWHVQKDVPYHAGLPLYESWDFGHKHPAVLWSQYVFGQWRVLGEVMGSGQFLEEFAPYVLHVRKQSFPKIRTVETVCDPTGGSTTSHGSMRTAVTILNEHDVWPICNETTKDYNTIPQKNYAIQLTGKLMMEMQRGGEPGFVVDARCKQFITGLEAGYIWSRKDYTSLATGNIRRPEKDGTYDHLQNCWEYTVLQWVGSGLSRKQYERQQAKKAAADVRKAMRDDGERYRRPGQVPMGRGGYR